MVRGACVDDPGLRQGLPCAGHGEAPHVEAQAMSKPSSLTLDEAIEKQRQLIDEGFGPHASAASKKFTNNIALTVIAGLFDVDAWKDERIKAAML
jgi:hypothetical protein